MAGGAALPVGPVCRERYAPHTLEALAGQRLCQCHVFLAPDPAPRLTAFTSWACAGAQPANKTYFCDAATSNCFVVVAAPRNYSSQKSYCSDVLSGTLVAHSSREKQLLVGGCCCSHRLQAWHDYE